MGRVFKFDITKNTLSAGLKKYFKLAGISATKSKGADLKAKKVVGLQMLNWVLNGSTKEPVVPPILNGILRGSGSVFVGASFIGDSSREFAGGTPNLSFKAGKDVITIGFNTAYATRQHEDLTPEGPNQLGPRSLQSGDVGGKFLERHLKADGKDAMGLYADVFKKETGG